jgi:signal transduction histidine kinase/HAMP domain-containing protein
MSKLLGNLRYQIALILLLAIVPLALLAVYLAVDDGRKDASRAQADSRATVRLVSQDLNRVIQSSSDMVLGFGRNSVIRNHPESCSAQLASLKPAFPQFANMVVIDTDSTVLCAASNPMNVRTLQGHTENLALMDRVREGRQAAVGAFVLSAPGKRVLPLMGPVFDEDGEIRSFFFVTVDLDWLVDQVNRIAVPKEAVLLVMDSRGTELARNPRSPHWPAGTPAPPFERTLVGTSDFDSEVKGEGGISRFYSVARVPAGEGLLVVMKMRSSEIYRPARRRLAWHLSGLGGGGLLILGLTWLGSNRYFTYPLSTLIRTADRLASGSLEARSGLKYSGDIGVLAQSFDRMADTLERDRGTALRTSQTFRSIIEGTSASTGEDFFRSLVRSLTSALEADFALVGEFTPDCGSVSTLAICADGQIVENTVYELRGTPCEGVLTANACYYEAGVQDFFPEDTMLRDLRMESYLGAPLVDEAGKKLGLIAVLCRRPMTHNVTDPLSMLKVFAARGSAELTRLRAERALRRSLAERDIAAGRNQEMVRTLQALTARLQSVREEERSRIAREIHDQLGQQLTAMRFDLISLRNRQMQASAKGEPMALPGNGFSDLTGMIDAMIADVRRIATELRPAILDTFGLNAAVEWLVEDFQKRTNICCVYSGMDDVQLDRLGIARELSTTVFRICQESLTNIARHSQASKAQVQLSAEGEWLSLQVSDNGKGISPEMLINTHSLGVVGMRERTRIAGGELIIGRCTAGRWTEGAGPGCGTSVVARFPLRLHEAAESTGSDPVKLEPVKSS